MFVQGRIGIKSIDDRQIVSLSDFKVGFVMGRSYFQYASSKLAIDMLISEKQFIGSIGGSCAPDRDFPTFLEWHDDGRLDLDALVTARYPIDEINEATRALEAGEISGRAILEFD